MPCIEFWKLHNVNRNWGIEGGLEYQVKWEVNKWWRFIFVGSFSKIVCVFQNIYFYRTEQSISMTLHTKFTPYFTRYADFARSLICQKSQNNSKIGRPEVNEINVWRYLVWPFIWKQPAKEIWTKNLRTFAIGYTCQKYMQLNSRQNGRHFADGIFKRMCLNETVWIPFKISLKFVPKVWIRNIPALVQMWLECWEIMENANVLKQIRTAEIKLWIDVPQGKHEICKNVKCTNKLQIKHEKPFYWQLYTACQLCENILLVPPFCLRACENLYHNQYKAPNNI